MILLNAHNFSNIEKMKWFSNNPSPSFTVGKELDFSGTCDDGETASGNASSAAAPSITARRRVKSDCLQRKLQYVYMIVTLYVAPIAAAVFLPLQWVAFLGFFSLGCVAFVNVWIVCEGILSFFYTRKQRMLHRSSPKLEGERRLCAIVAAYLPNELTVLVETVKAIAAQIKCLPDGTTLDIVLSHNGGSKEQRIALLEDLRKIEKEIPDNVIVHELFVVASKSKAANVNGALAFLQDLCDKRLGEFTQIAMYDADHQPIPEAYRYALETMQDQKADMVMGRCCVRDGYKFVAVEFDVIYGVAHAGGRMLRGFGFFGGSNGYWDYKTLQETGMDEGMLTEDIDSSFRAQAVGHKMTYDSTIVSYEEAPPTLLALFKQRLRWSQGWFEVTIRQRSLIVRGAPGLTSWSRFCIFMLLPFREMYAYLSSMKLPIAIVYLVRSGCGVACLDMKLFALFAAFLTVPIWMTFSAWFLTFDREKKVHYRMPALTSLDYVGYIFVIYVYEFVKLHVTVLAHARHFLGLNAWVVTKRKTTTKSTTTEECLEQVADMPAQVPISRPESIVESSPFAPSIRRLFAQSMLDNNRHELLVKEETCVSDTESGCGDESGRTSKCGSDDHDPCTCECESCCEMWA